MPNDAMVPLATQIPEALTCETDVSLIAMPQADELHYVDNGATQGIAVLQHLDVTHHELRFYPLAVTSGAVTTPGPTTFHTAPDMVGLTVAPVGTGYVAAFTDTTSATAHVITVDASFQETGDAPLTGLAWATTPLAHKDASGLVVAQNTSTTTIDVAFLDANLQPTGNTVTIDGAADSFPAIAPDPTGYVVAWDHPSGGACTVARISSDGIVLAGPLSVTPPGATACARPSVLALTDGTIIMTMLDATVSMSPVAYAAVTGETLAATTPLQIGDPDSFVPDLIAGGTRAYVAVRTTGDSRVTAVLDTGSVSPLGSDFGLTGNDADTEALVVLAGALVHIRTEGGNLIIRKLCR